MLWMFHEKSKIRRTGWIFNALHTTTIVAWALGHQASIILSPRWFYKPAQQTQKKNDILVILHVTREAPLAGKGWITRYSPRRVSNSSANARSLGACRLITCFWTGTVERQAKDLRFRLAGCHSWSWFLIANTWGWDGLGMLGCGHKFPCFDWSHRIIQSKLAVSFWYMLGYQYSAIFWPRLRSSCSATPEVHSKKRTCSRNDVERYVIYCIAITYPHWLQDLGSVWLRNGTLHRRRLFMIYLCLFRCFCAPPQTNQKDPKGYCILQTSLSAAAGGLAARRV